MKVQDLSSWFESFIGEGKRFSTRAEAARDLGLPKSKATKFFDFLDGKDTGYTSVLDWFEKMGGFFTPATTRAFLWPTLGAYIF